MIHIASNISHSLLSIFQVAVEREASDIHLVAESVPLLRVNGTMAELGIEVLSEGEMTAFLAVVLSDQARQKLEREKNLDVALALPVGGGQTRHRAGGGMSRWLGLREERVQVARLLLQISGWLAGQRGGSLPDSPRCVRRTRPSAPSPASTGAG